MKKIGLMTILIVQVSFVAVSVFAAESASYTLSAPSSAEDNSSARTYNCEKGSFSLKEIKPPIGSKAVKAYQMDFFVEICSVEYWSIPLDVLSVAHSVSLVSKDKQTFFGDVNATASQWETKDGGKVVKEKLLNTTQPAALEIEAD